MSSSEFDQLTEDYMPENNHENDDFSEDDNKTYIEQILTGNFMQDTMMYKPFRIIPPSPRRSTYVFRLDTWLYGMLRPMYGMNR